VKHLDHSVPLSLSPLYIPAMGKSSKDKRDAYYRLAKEQGWRARSAFKLLQIDEQFDLFRDVTRVVDLCAAPGSWSQVLSRVLIKGESFGRRAWEEKQAREMKIIYGDGEEGKIGEEGEKEQATTEGELRPREGVKIVAVDLQPMAHLEGITTLKGDITHPATIPRILQALDPDTYKPDEGQGESGSNPVDLVLSDGAPDVTGLHDLDIYIQSQLLYSALNLALKILKPGGAFVAKVFRGRNVDCIYAQLRCFFKSVHCAKPRSSRASSLEAFVVCQGFEIPKGFVLDPERPVGLGAQVPVPPRKPKERKQNDEFVDGQKPTIGEDGVAIVELDSDSEDDMRWIAPFVACGDLSAWDADATYHLPKDRISLDPVQPPTAPPYKQALELRRQRGGLYGKTGKEIRKAREGWEGS
jgi:tRNA (cytidine32/guanosine34-2'-O)-methyltransferase